LKRERYLLDASALLSILLEERGSERVNRILDRSRIHAANLAEVVARLVRAGMPPEAAVAALHELDLDVDELFGAAEAEACGTLQGSRRDLGLSLGDCLCLTAAAWSGAVAVTADRCWEELNGTKLGDHIVQVEIIRGS
jgi:PIN domain nuclease of toxin-antitoxin system